VISKLLLPEDLMIHIFTLVPLNCLINSAKYVCKPWAAIIRSAHFVEACQRRSKPSLYIENCTKRCNSYLLEFKDDVNGQFERTDFGTPQKMGHLISTCDGIFLLWNEHNNGSRESFVVNPLLKCWLRISPFPDNPFRDYLEYIAVSCQCNITRVPRTAKFKLFLMDSVKFSGAFWYVFYVLRIGIDNSWKEITRKQCPPSWSIFWQQLYSGGNDIYWITKKEVIVMDVDKEVILREYPLPHFPNYPAPKYLLMGNRLSCIASKDFSNDLSDDLSSTTYQIYILDFDSGKWSVYLEMGPFDYVVACGHELDIMDVVFRFWIDDQIIFRVTLDDTKYIFTNLKNKLFGYNVKTKQLTKIEGIDVDNFEVWLHTNSLISFPSTST
jgi:hypothetical protein